MAGFNLFNQTTTTTTPFATPNLNTTPAFGATPNQQNVSFGSTSTPAFETASTSNTSGFGMLKPQFGSTNTSLFANPNTTATQAGLTFGSNVQSSSLAQPKPFGGLSFTSTPTSLSFGSPATSQTGVPFGIPASFSQPGVAFGTPPNPAAAPQTGVAFGMPANPVAASQTGVAFGTSANPVAAPQTGIAFGTSANPVAAPQTGIAFGTSANPVTAQQTGVAFGTFTNPVATSQTGVAFGSPANPVAALQTGITFGTPTSAATTAPQTGISFGMQNASPQTSTFASAQKTKFGSAQPTAFGSVQTTTFGSTQPSTFGMPAATTTQTGLSFGMPATTSTAGLVPSTLGVTTTTAPVQGLSFGTTSTSQPSLSFSAGSSLSTTAVTSAPSLFTSLGSGTSTSTSSTPSLFGNLTSTAAPSSTTASGGIFSWHKPVTEGVTAAPSSTTSIGLGGVDHSAVTTAQSSANTVTCVKEQPLPNEIQQTVVSFKEHVKTQKNLSSEVARSSAEPLTKLTQQITALNNLIINLGSVLSQQKFTAEKIKLETIKSLNDYELAQKIKDSPVASEERLLSIRKYFTEKISSFEESTKALQEKIEYVYQHVSTLPQENSLSAEALKLIVKKLHDSFVVIGARAYKLHNDMQLLKVQYMTLRNQYVKDNSSISFSLNRELQLPTEARAKSSDLALEGPNPFSRTGNGSFNSLLLTSQNRSFVTSTSSSSVGGLLNTSKPFGFSDVSGVSLFDQSTSPGLSTGQQFNLQKPPLGNKRGKR